MSGKILNLLRLSLKGYAPIYTDSQVSLVKIGREYAVLKEGCEGSEPLYTSKDLESAYIQYKLQTEC